MKTRIYKSYSNGWQADTLTEADANGNAWQISTSKSRVGVSCKAIQGHVNERNMFSYEMFGAKRMDLYSEAGQCTEKKVTTVHNAGIAEFNRIMAENKPEKPAYVIEVGQIIFTDFIHSGEDNKRVIYEITSPGNYKTVTTDGKHLTQDDRIRPYSEKFGIGVYYNEGEKMPVNEVLQLVESAKQHEAAEALREAEAAQKAAKERAEKIEAGRKILAAIPAGVVAIIVGECRQNDSDLQSDYHAYSTTETVYLAWSTHKRDLFTEMRKAAAKFEGTKHFEHPEPKPEGESENWTPSDENREKYSMGSGYYLGNKYSGWIVQKMTINPESAEVLQALQIAAAEGRFYCGEFEAETEAPNIEPLPVQTGKVQVIEYGSGLAVIGDTKPIKDKLKELGGRFNFRLTCGCGWVFPKSKLEALKAALAA